MQTETDNRELAYFPNKNIVFVYGGLLDPENKNDFCKQMFPKTSAMELLVEQDALKAIQDDDSAELYRIDKNSGSATRLSNRNNNSSAFPERLTRDYLREQRPMARCFTPAPGNWFWVLNCGSDSPHIVVERIVAWENTPNGYIGLISEKLKGAFLQSPPPILGGTYKHYDDLSPKEIEALESKKKDHTWDQQMGSGS